MLTCRLIMTVLLILALAAPVAAQKRKKKDPLEGLSPAADAGLRLVVMQHKGLINLVLGDPNPILFVEPLAWQNMTHHSKVQLGTLALLYVNGLKKEQNLSYEFVFILDMTTKEKLGTVYLKRNRVEIFK